MEYRGACPGRRWGSGKRAFPADELQALFDYADDQVTVVRGRRKGWLPAFRDAALFKVAYGFGLRRTAMLDLADFGANPPASEFGELGLCRVRFGKAMQGSRRGGAAC